MQNDRERLQRLLSGSIEPRITELASGLRFPEGPVAMADGSILIVEIESGFLTRIRSGRPPERLMHLAGGPNGAALGPDGHCYICNNGGFSWHEDPGNGLRPTGQADSYDGGWIERVDLATGQVERLYTACDGHQLKGPNDLVFDAHGGFYFTDFGKVRAREHDLGAVYYARADGSSIREVAFPMFGPNGVGLSPDGGMLYVAETETARLWEFQVQGPGHLDRLSWPPAHGGRLVAGIGGYRKFDSLAVDPAGNIWVGTLMDGGLTVISPDGKLIRHFPLPDRFVTNLCFAYDGSSRAYVTLSGAGKLVEFAWD